METIIFRGYVIVLGSVELPIFLHIQVDPKKKKQLSKTPCFGMIQQKLKDRFSHREVPNYLESKEVSGRGKVHLKMKGLVVFISKVTYLSVFFLYLDI